MHSLLGNMIAVVLSVKVEFLGCKERNEFPEAPGEDGVSCKALPIM